MTLEKLSADITACTSCPRLIAWCEDVAAKRKKQYRDFKYWGRPVPGFGDPEAELIIIGLAPGAHGANRTGRVFTGDESGVWLYDALHRYGFANQPTSENLADGLTLTGAYINNIVRCVPPDNKPSAEEIQTCRPHLVHELQLLSRKKVVLALGQLAFKQYLTLLKEQGIPVKGLTFAHGAHYDFGPEHPKLLVSYHPSQQNTRTGVLTREMWYRVFETCQGLLGEQ
ncbi:uracil-DNA glycosylase [Tumebacillus permanentifrigoris]|uniref:Type-5 uracil-DNA glycosylase n=1 Tax=Tumebacillus permanentifrigoris TaxID=378543 RepID=A0A316DV28_9BACL|nr:uracil-DNA glycosylase [Tumebacillus permanentifrigoris]PWK13042.1 uracil-DNA glycosylase family 4 [Tumebacillus permanentifrigoris]